MKRQCGKSNSRFLTVSIVLVLLLVGCAQSPTFCPALPQRDLSEAAAFAGDDRLPFQFPLDKFDYDAAPRFTNFCTSSSGPESARQYHAAEDFFQPAGTPVYAMADGKISFSGPMGGYGWLIIVDHPPANIYSLYGHLSPSRWRMESGTVKKGELIAYLGDADENGGSAEKPLVPHLHFGIRAGQRAGYSAMGEWRWQAGWIKPCPQDIGWLQPSAVIANQKIPAGGFAKPTVSLAGWWLEILFTGIYAVGAGCMLIYATRRDKPFVPVLSGGFLTIAGWVFRSKGARLSAALFAIAALSLVIGTTRLVRRATQARSSQA